LASLFFVTSISVLFALALVSGRIVDRVPVPSALIERFQLSLPLTYFVLPISVGRSCKVGYVCACAWGLHWTWEIVLVGLKFF